ncbi:hypothetical protein JCM10212_001747 [Sporobolomyces blumeae]
MPTPPPSRGDTTPLLSSSASSSTASPRKPLASSTRRHPASPRDADDGAYSDDVRAKGGPRQGRATLVSCIANLANTIIGTGALAMAHAFAGEGLVPGMLAIVLCATTAYLGLYFLTRCARMAPHRQASFSSLSQLTFPSLQRLFDLAVAVKCFGVSISYLIVIGGLMPKVVRSFNPSMELTSILLDRRLWILLSMTLLCPLAFLRKLDSLKVTSYIALCAIAYLVFIVVFYTFFRSADLPSPGDVELFKLGPEFVTSLPVQIFAFTCAQNIFAVFNELKSNTQPRLNLVVGTSIGSAALIYEVLGVLGYLAFGSKVGGNLIEMYPHTTAVSICQLGITVLVLFSYPLQLHPCRASLDKFLFPAPRATSPALSGSEGARDALLESDESDEGEDDDSSTLSPGPSASDSSSTAPIRSSRLVGRKDVERGRSKGAAGGADPASDEIPLTRFIVESSVILFSTFVIAMFVSSLETVLGFVGATGSTTISFILPSVFFLALFKDSPSRKDQKLRWLAAALLAWGVIVMVLSLSMNIYHLVQRPETSSLHTLGYLGGKTAPLHAGQGAAAAAAALGPTTELPIDGR